MLINLHDWSETSWHRDICASPSRQEAAASPSPTQLTERLTASCGNLASLGDVFSSVLPQCMLVIPFPVQFKHFCTRSVIFFLMLCISELTSCCFIIPTWPPLPPGFESFFPFQKGFPHIYLSLIRSLCIYPNISSHPKYSNAFVFCAQRVVCVCTSVYMYACMRMC